MHIPTVIVRTSRAPRTFTLHKRSPRKVLVRNLTTTSTRRSILGLDRTTHWSKPFELSRGPTRAEIALQKEEWKASPRRIKVYPCPVPSARAACKDPLASITETQLAVLDPEGTRTKLFNKDYRECAKVGDILLVRTKEGDPISGVCINIRRRGVDTSILLRNHVTRVGVEMWIKVYSPNVQGIEIVKRKEKRARRARLYYMRKPKHDIGSVQNIVQHYMRQRQALRYGGAGGEGNLTYKSPKRQNKNKKKNKAKK